MGEPVVVESGEYTAEELLSLLQDGERLTVRTEVLGSEAELTLRFDGDVYYCDTPTTLHRHETAAEMAECMKQLGYVTDAA